MTEPQTDTNTVPASAPSKPVTPSRRARGQRLALGLAGGLVGLLVIGGIVLTQLDWNRAKPWLNQTLSDATGRHVAVEGDRSLRVAILLWAATTMTRRLPTGCFSSRV